MNVLNAVFAYILLMAVHEKLLCTNDFFFQNVFDSAIFLQKGLY